MKTQPLVKRLLIPLLLIGIAAIGVGLSSPAQSASLMGSRGTVIAANLEEQSIEKNNVKWCQPGQPPPLCRIPGPNTSAPEAVRFQYSQYLLRRAYEQDPSRKER